VTLPRELGRDDLAGLTDDAEVLRRMCVGVTSFVAPLSSPRPLCRRWCGGIGRPRRQTHRAPGSSVAPASTVSTILALFRRLVVDRSEDLAIQTELAADALDLDVVDRDELLLAEVQDLSLIGLVGLDGEGFES
jgi:hypothetical protein